MNLLFLIIGLVMLVLGGDWLVKSGVSIAGKFKIPPLIIGLTIVSMGTSMPELAVSAKAALKGYSDLAIGNVIGSNIANISLILGLTAVIISLPVSRETVVFTWPVMLFSVVLLWLFTLDYSIQRWEGLILLLMLPIFIVLLWRRSKNNPETQNNEAQGKIYSIGVSLIILVLSIVCLVYGGNFLIGGAIGIGQSLGISERTISLTVVAFGTSAPELATSLVAAYRKQTDISIGNLIGSNIFNIFAILGVTTIIKPIYVGGTLVHFDIPFNIGIVLLVGLCFIPLKNPKITRWKGLILAASYILYFFLVFK
ncbi:MAG: calcium/sodium antiporter [Bacteroidales bacterium]|nr:calcium/sodium antiporter [Bacteroidales bacterium]